MNGQFHSSFWRGGHGERLWLSTLIDTMEEVAQQPARRADPEAVKILRAQLTLPAQPRFTSPFSLRN
jgi:hypothetical protein